MDAQFIALFDLSAEPTFKLIVSSGQAKMV